MCGGADEISYQTSNRPVENARYSVFENRWWSLPPLRRNRRQHAATIYRSHLVVAGGGVRSVEALALDPTTGDRLPSPLSGVAAVT